MTVEMLMAGERAAVAAASDGAPPTLRKIPTVREPPANSIVGLRRCPSVRQPTFAL
jgi:hypothetical protein